MPHDRIIMDLNGYRHRLIEIGVQLWEFHNNEQVLYPKPGSLIGPAECGEYRGMNIIITEGTKEPKPPSPNHLGGEMMRRFVDRFLNYKTRQSLLADIEATCFAFNLPFFKNYPIFDVYRTGEVCK